MKGHHLGSSGRRHEGIVCFYIVYKRVFSLSASHNVSHRTLELDIITQRFCPDMPSHHWGCSEDPFQIFVLGGSLLSP